MKLKGKQFLGFGLSAILACGLVVGCGGLGDQTDTNTNSSSNREVDDFNKTATIQGTIMDATTGARIGGTDLTVKLIQGNDVRTPNRLVTDITDPLVGDFSFSDVPIAINGADVKYKVVVTNSTGYQRFEGITNINASGLTATTQADELVNRTYNFVRDIYLYPIGATAGDIVLFVQDNDGERVGGATVVLNPNNAANTLVGNTTASVIAQTNGYLPSLTGTTCTAANVTAATTNCTTTADIGKVVFAGSTLALGGNYTPTVLPIKNNDRRLALTAGAAVAVSTGNLTQVIAMADQEPNGEEDGLFAVWASNEDADDVDADGVLTIVFNRPIALTQESLCTATLTNADVAVLATDDPAVTTDDGADVTAAVSTDGFTLTLTPVYLTDPQTTAGDTTDDSLVITYAGCQITLSGNETGEAKNVFGSATLLDASGNALSGAVNVNGPQ